MRGIIGIGDNVVDKYIDLGKMFPGGNTLNVSVFCKRYGIDSAYIGSIGKDREGDLILRTLKNEEVDISRIRVLDGLNAYANVKLIDGDRSFVGNDRGVSRNIELDDRDLEYIKNYDIIHTSIYSGIEKLLPLLKKLGKAISFDFSNTYTMEYLEKILPYVDYAYFSGSHYTDSEIKNLQEKVKSMDPKLVLVTKGSRGASLYYKDNYYEQRAIPTKLVDTLGTGDGFIARVLAGILFNEDIQNTLRYAAKEASKICTYNGAIGHGVNIRYLDLECKG